MKIIFIFACSGMFRNVPACSGMFHVPDFIDGRFDPSSVTELTVVYFKLSTVQSFSCSQFCLSL